MQLMMYLGNDLVEAVPLNLEEISRPGYLGKFKRVMKEKYAELIKESPVPPEFLVVAIDAVSKEPANQDQSNSKAS